MKKNQQKQYIDEVINDGDNPEWTAEDFKKAVSFSALPEDLQIILKGIQKPTKSTKHQISGATILH